MSMVNRECYEALNRCSDRLFCVSLHGRRLKGRERGKTSERGEGMSTWGSVLAHSFLLCAHSFHPLSLPFGRLPHRLILCGCGNSPGSGCIKIFKNMWGFLQLLSVFQWMFSQCDGFSCTF